MGGKKSNAHTIIMPQTVIVKSRFPVHPAGRSGGCRIGLRRAGTAASLQSGRRYFSVHSHFKTALSGKSLFQKNRSFRKYSFSRSENTVILQETKKTVWYLYSDIGPIQTALPVRKHFLWRLLFVCNGPVHDVCPERKRLIYRELFLYCASGQSGKHVDE